MKVAGFFLPCLTLSPGGEGEKTDSKSPLHAMERGFRDKVCYSLVALA
jgi:hypothetical protein